MPKMKVLGTMLASSMLFALAGTMRAEGADAPAPSSSAARPWMNTTLSPDARAALVVKQLTLTEKIQLVHGTGWASLIPGNPIPEGWNYGAGYVPGLARLGIPGIHMDDSAVGVRGAATLS
ncbi:MAG TPA: glycosyl hydrolase, partial [Rhodanobacter sp.]|nr:glycosyl hydrolase [Rhodanobacter sp.]